MQRRARLGSIAVARRAGKYAATAATMIKMAATEANPSALSLGQ
jgi:hypothetical protein